MRRTLLLLALTIPLSAQATDAKARDIGWSPKHPISLGARAGAWGGQYLAPGIGGHLKIRPVKWLGVELIADHFGSKQQEAILHDHVIGFSLYAPSLIGTDRWYLAPTLGSCVDFRYMTPLDDRPANSGVLFGAHGGAMFEYFATRHWSLEVNATATAYYGNKMDLEGWTASTSNDLQVQGVVQAFTALNYTF